MLPLEVIAQRQVGEIDTATMIKTLLTMSMRPGTGDAHNPWSDGVAPGDWAEVGDAVGRGWLTNEEYETVALGRMRL